MKSFSAIVYVEPAVRSIGAPVQVPSAACRTAPVPGCPTAASMLYVKHSPETCGKRPLAPGIERDAVLEHRLELGAVDLDGDHDVAERQHRQDLAAGDQVRRRREGRAEARAAAGRRAGQAVAQATRVGDREFDADRRVLRPHRVGRHVADERLAEPPVGATAHVGPQDLDGRRADHGAEDRLQLGVEVVDLGLDGRIGRDADVHGLWKSAVL